MKSKQKKMDTPKPRTTTQKNYQRRSVKKKRKASTPIKRRGYGEIWNDLTGERGRDWLMTYEG